MSQKLRKKIIKRHHMGDSQSSSPKNLYGDVLNPLRHTMLQWSYNGKKQSLQWPKWCQDISSYAISTYAVSTAANSIVHNFNRFQFHPFTLSTFCNFNLRPFQPITLPPNCSQTVLIMKAFMVISKAKKRVQQLTIIFHTMKCYNYLQRFIV